MHQKKNWHLQPILLCCYICSLWLLNFFHLHDFHVWLLCFVKKFHLNNVFIEFLFFLCSCFVIYFYYVVYLHLYLFDIASFQNPHVHLEVLKVHFILELVFLCFIKFVLQLWICILFLLISLLFFVTFYFQGILLLSFFSFYLFIGIYVNWVTMFVN